MAGVGLKLLDVVDAGGASIGAAGLSVERIRSAILRILEENVLCTIATVNEAGRPHISTAYFCYSEELELYFLSHPDSRHCRNLRRTPAAAAAVFSTAQQWTGPDRGIQLVGTCAQARGGHAAKAVRLYGVRFPAYRDWRAGLETGDLGSRYRYFRFVGREIQILDEAELGDAAFVRVDVVGSKRRSRERRRTAERGT